MELSKETLELLRDEAYVLLSREAILAQLETKNRDKAPVALGALAGGKVTGLAAAHDPEVALYSRLTRLSRLELWLQQRLRFDLIAHLTATHGEFQVGVRLQQALNEWDFCVRHVLPESLAEFARELRGLRQAAADAHRRGGLASGPEFGALRRLAGRVEEQQLQVARIEATIAGHARQIGATAMLPPSLPNFRRLVWVDWLSVVPVDQLLSEVHRIEGEVRQFLNQQLPALLTRVEASRSACSARQEAILTAYWDRLRTYAQARLVEEQEVDTVLDSLSFRYEPEIARREEARLNPFAPT